MALKDVFLAPLKRSGYVPHAEKKYIQNPSHWNVFGENPSFLMGMIWGFILVSMLILILGYYAMIVLFPLALFTFISGIPLVYYFGKKKHSFIIGLLCYVLLLILFWLVFAFIIPIKTPEF